MSIMTFLWRHNIFQCSFDETKSYFIGGFKFFGRFIDLSQIDRIHRNFNFTNYIVFTKSIKIINCQNHCFTTNFLVWNFFNFLHINVTWGQAKVESRSNQGWINFRKFPLKSKVSLKTGFKLFFWTFVSNFFFLSYFAILWSPFILVSSRSFYHSEVTQRPKAN